MDPAQPRLIADFVEQYPRQASTLEDKVRAELLAARKSREGLSPTSMALCPVIRDLLGAGDPLVAFQSLQHRILASLASGEDHRALEAAAYSLGLGSRGDTHLSRLVEFGQEHGYEARQARRHSDRGIQLLARLITTNWIVDTVPSLDVVLLPYSRNEIAANFQATRLAVVHMQPITAISIGPDGRETLLQPRVSTVSLSDGNSSSDDAGQSERIVDLLVEPLLLPKPTPGSSSHLRLQWRGEVWPKIAVSLPEDLGPTVQFTAQTLASTLQISLAGKAVDEENQ